ncbi:MAG: acyltransferase family protein [Muribaculaceae bacterium]|jgi:surface polysaccharide O-acyltransferase-like enzyme|nr:acyltransferase family protein [Muribaculaceae bacterium]
MTKQGQSRKRIHYLDTLRVIACAFVLLMHAPNHRYAEFDGNYTYAVYLMIINICSKLFFMLSGALLLPVKKSLREFVPHRLKVILIPLAIWSAVYLAEMLITGTEPENGKTLLRGTFYRYLFSIPFNPVESKLWFVYMMAAFYMFMPVLSKCLTAMGKRYTEYYLCIWMIASLVPYMGGFFMAPDLQHNMFSSFANYLGYVVLGYYLHNYPLPIFTKKHWWKFFTAFAVFCVGLPLFVFLFQCKYLDFHDQLTMVTGDMGINTILMGILIYTFVQRFTPKDIDDNRPHHTTKFMTRLSICTFGIYLGHMLVIRHIVWPLAEKYLGTLPALTDGIICAVAGFVLTYIVIRIIYCLPFSRYIIGH